MKPVELFEYQMLNNTKGDDLVLDSFAGSGTTAISCEKHGRRARMMELCRAGEIRTNIQMVEGFEQTPTALRDMLLGKYTGKVLVRYANAAPSISGTTA